MEKHYKVFVSSTYVDLQNARREVFEALLKSDCFPSGMELFPAADMEQFEYIKQVINDCDYYIIISAGKYGSIHPTHEKSFTELEYDYARECGKPIIRLLHKSPFETLTGDLLEQSDSSKTKLKEFRKKLLGTRLVNFWTDPKDLGQQVILALLDAKKRFPTSGWVKGDNAITVEMLEELHQLRKSSQNRSKNETKQSVVSFDELKKETHVKVLAANFDDDVNANDVAGKLIGESTVGNAVVAEAVFLAMIDNQFDSDIFHEAYNLISYDFDFPEEAKKYTNFWVEFDFPKLKSFLHYLESRGLAKAPYNSLSGWTLTQKGRLHATFISSRKALL